MPPVCRAFGPRQIGRALVYTTLCPALMRYSTLLSWVRVWVRVGEVRQRIGLSMRGMELEARVGIEPKFSCAVGHFERSRFFTTPRSLRTDRLKHQPNSGEFNFSAAIF